MPIESLFPLPQTCWQQQWSHVLSHGQQIPLIWAENTIPVALGHVGEEMQFKGLLHTPAFLLLVWCCWLAWQCSLGHSGGRGVWVQRETVPRAARANTCTQVCSRDSRQDPVLRGEFFSHPIFLIIQMLTLTVRGKKNTFRISFGIVDVDNLLKFGALFTWTGGLLGGHCWQGSSWTYSEYWKGKM